MINRAVLTGRLTRDPELRYTTSGTAVVSFTLAVDRQFRNQNGDRDADFVNCVIWRKSAENFSNFTHKGSLVGVEGRIQTRNYENQQGNRVYVTEVVVDNFALLEPRQNGGMNQGGQQQPFNNGSNPVVISHRLIMLLKGIHHQITASVGTPQPITMRLSLPAIRIMTANKRLTCQMMNYHSK